MCYNEHEQQTKEFNDVQNCKWWNYKKKHNLGWNYIWVAKKWQINTGRIRRYPDFN